MDKTYYFVCRKFLFLLKHGYVCVWETETQRGKVIDSDTSQAAPPRL